MEKSKAKSDIARPLSQVKKFFPALLGLVFVLISLGGAVRAMDAGLACPDWPLCFGKVVPHFDIQIFYEWIHRKVAATVGFLTLGIGWVVFRSRQVSVQTKWALGFALLILVCQVILGGLTVLKLLHFGVVTAHLGFGMAFFGTLFWFYFLLSRDLKNLSDPSRQLTESQDPYPLSYVLVVFFALVLVFAQILLGGLVSSNYAGLACGQEFPLCHGSWAPTLSGLVGLHVLHRFGAYWVLVTIISLVIFTRRHRGSTWSTESLQRIAFGLLMATGAQILVGISNVLLGIPALITVLHLGLAAGIFVMLLRILFFAYSQLGFESPISRSKESMVTGSGGVAIH